MLGPFIEAIYVRKSRTKGHLDQCAFGRVTADGPQALVLARGLVEKEQHRRLLRQANAFDQEELAGEGLQDAHGAEGIFQVIEQAEGKHHIEAAERDELRIFDVRNVEGDAGMAAARFCDICFARIHCADLESHIPQRRGEVPYSASDVEDRAQAERLLPLRQEASEKLAPGSHEIGLCGMVKDK